MLPFARPTGQQTVPSDRDKKDRPNDAADPRAERSFVEHLLNQPKGPETPRAGAAPRDVEF